MALQPKRLYIGNTTASNVYSVADSTGAYTIIKTLHICNTSASDKTFNMHIVPSGGSPANNNKIFHNVTIKAGEVLYSDSVYVLNQNESIYYDPIDSNLTLLLTGVESV